MIAKAPLRQEIQRFVEQRLVSGGEQPAADAGGMRKRKEKHAIAFAEGANDLLQARFAAEGFNRHATDQEDHPGAKEAQLGVQVGTTERHFSRGGTAVAVASGIASGIAAGKRAEIDMTMQVAGRKTGPLQPFLENTAAGTAK